MSRKRVTIVAAVALAGLALGATADEAKAQCYSYYSYGYAAPAAPVIVAPAPVIVPAAPAYYGPVYTTPRVVHHGYYHQRSYHRGYRGYHRPRGFSFGFGYYR